MLSAVEVARLLEGVAAALRTHVEPHVDDRFARMQLRAIDELLRNLADRVEWSLAELQAELAGMEELLARLREAGWPGHVAAAETPAATYGGGPGSSPHPARPALRGHALGATGGIGGAARARERVPA